MTIEYVSHEEYPDDAFTKEIVCLNVNGIRYNYICRRTKDGGAFWGKMSSCVAINGEKKYVESHLFQDAFLNDDCITFCKARSWAKNEVKREVINASIPTYATYTPPIPAAAQQMTFIDESDNLPF